jgi:CheY-like chemotaxis protein
MVTVPRGPVILCVDDDTTGLHFRQLILERKGYQVLVANSGAHAIEVFESHPVDLVVADHLMGSAMGTALAAALKQLRPQVPIIILSGNISPPEGAENADAYLCKSDGPEILLGSISALLAACPSAHPEN